VVVAVLELHEDGYPIDIPTCQAPVRTEYAHLQCFDAGTLWQRKHLFLECEDISHESSAVQVRDGFKTAWAQQHSYPYEVHGKNSISRRGISLDNL
jgi:hypothetical protein